MVITDPEADPYACSHDGGSSYKCGYKSAFHIFVIILAKNIFSSHHAEPSSILRFSDIEAFAKVQYSAPMHEEQEEFWIWLKTRSFDCCPFQKLPRIQFSEEGFFVRMATVWLLFLLKSCFLAHHAQTAAFLATAPTAEAETGKKLNTLLFKWVDHVLQNLWLNSCLIFQL